MYLREYFGMVAFMIVMALCQVAGVGGGGINEPLNMAFFEFKTKEAVGLSSFIILICTLCRTVYTFKARNPDKPNQKPYRSKSQATSANIRALTIRSL
jgi:uncharacterized membrane protein YfcA